MATRGIVPRADGEGKLGTTEKKWGEANVNNLLVEQAATVTGKATVGGLASSEDITLTRGKAIKDSTGENVIFVDQNKPQPNQKIDIGNTNSSVNIPGYLSVKNLQSARTDIKRNTAYKVGDIATSPNLPSWAYLECVTAGTTGATEPDFSTVTDGG